MVIALYGVAFAMVVSGLAALAQGYAIIMVERGWTLVIAGTIAMTSGAILAGITYGVSRLALLQEELVRLREGLGRPDVAYAPPALSGEASEPSLDPVLLDMDALTAAVAGSAPSPEPTTTSSEVRPLPEARPFEAKPPGSQPQLPESKPSEPIPVSEVTAARAPSAPLTPAPERPELAGPLRRMRTGLERSILEGDGRERRDSVQPSPRADFAEAQPVEPAIFADEPARPAPAAAAAIQAEDPSDILVPAASDEPPVVIGTYDSGGNRYVMFSDGSIEADTPGGQFRFKSLDELKEFIAMGGENGPPQAAGART